MKNAPPLISWGWLRALLLLFTFFFFLLLLEIVILVCPYLQSLSDLSLLRAVFSCIAVVASTFLCRRYIDRASYVSIGLSVSKRAPDMVKGFLCALLLLGVGTLILSFLGFYQITQIHFSPKDLIYYFVIFVLVGFYEEVLVRGYILHNMMQSMNKYLALFLSSLLFSLLHLFNPGFETLSFINLTLAGILLGSAYIFTQNLWFAISLHIFWNFIQGPFLGYQVSGLESPSFFQTKIADNWFTGGAFGFESSLLCTALIAISIVLSIGYHNKSLSS